MSAGELVLAGAAGRAGRRASCSARSSSGVIVRPVETGPEINAVIVTLGLFVGFVALAVDPVRQHASRPSPRRSALAGLELGGTTSPSPPTDIYKHRRGARRDGRAAGCCSAFTSLGLQMRASAFGQEVARLLGVRVGRMLTLGWALAGLFGSLAGMLIAGGGWSSPGYMDGVVVFGFVAAVLGGLDSFVGAVVGGLVARADHHLRAGLRRQRARRRSPRSRSSGRAAAAARRAVLQLRREEGLT